VSPTVLGLEPLAPGRLRLSSVLWFYRARLRSRWVPELLAIAGVAMGVALVYATQVASTSSAGSVRALNDELVGGSQIQLLARGFADLPQSRYEGLAALPGVARSAPILQVPGSVTGPRGEHAVTFTGADPRVIKLRGKLLRGLSGGDAAQQEAVVLPERVAKAIGVGMSDLVRLQIGGRAIIHPVAVANRDNIGELADTSLAVVPIAYLQRLARTGRRVTRVLIETRPGHEAQVRRQLERLAVGGGADVRPGDHEARLFGAAIAPTLRASALFGSLGALAGWLLAVCALLVTAVDRRKLALQQREQGYRPSHTVLTLLVDAAVVGAVGTAVGLAAGEALSRQGFHADIDLLSGAFPVIDQRVVTAQSVAVAAAAGMLAATFGVLMPVAGLVKASVRWPGRRCRAPRVADAVAWRVSVALGLGLAGLAAAAAIATWAPERAAAGLVVLALALVLLVPATLAGAIAALDWVAARRPSLSAVMLGLHPLTERRERVRVVAITTTVAVAVFAATALRGGQANLDAGLGDVARGLSDGATLWTSTEGAGGVAGTIPFSPVAARPLTQGMPGARVALYRAGLLDVAGRRAWVAGPPAEVARPLPARQVLEGDEATANARIRAGGWVAVSRGIADDLALGVGDRLVVPTPRPLTLRVAAITTNLGWAAGALVMNATDVARGWGGPSIAAIQVRTRPKTSLDEARWQLVETLGARSPLRVETAAQRADRQSAAGRQSLSRVRQVSALTLLAAVLAATIAMTGLLWQQRGLIAARKRQGLLTGLLWRSLVVEAAVLLGVGALLGGALGLLGQVLCTRGLRALTDFPVADQLRPGVAAGCIGLTVATALLVVLVPGYRLARGEPAWRG
jgi:putative ABC transport system permease protein